MSPAPAMLHAKAERYRISLASHLMDTEQAVLRLFSPERRWGQRWCAFFKIPPGQEPRFLRNLQVAALLHDIGKANHDFQAMVTRKSGSQAIRHEHLGALLLHLPVLRDWMRADPRLDLEVITAAVLAHHIKASDDGDHAFTPPAGLHRDHPVPVYFDHPEVRATLERIATLTELPPCPALPCVPFQAGPPWREAYKAGRTAATQLRRALEPTRVDHDRRALLLATKAGLIAADAASSGLTREGRAYAWLDDIASQAPVTPADIEAAILSKRTDAIEASTGRRFRYQSFQELAAREPSRLLLLAACGSGKTLAAWRWAQAQAAHHSAGRVIFLYPTRATATEGFRDYVGFAPEDQALLLHGTSAYELQEMAANATEGALRGKDFSLSEADARLFALGLWPRRYFSATVDQFLSFLEHDYQALCLLPALADSLLIIDEIHSFDRHMFDLLLHFLRTFDLPVLCMTATLDPTRRRQLEETGMTAFPRPEHASELLDLAAEEEHPRYQLERLATESDALTRALAAYQAGLRVLWVVNQVARCQRLARDLSEQLARPIPCYHSRFTLKDRKEQHQRTIADFQQRARPTLAVTTQVCEMSLDLDADVLISEEAPMSSLVQRFGRANRKRHGKASGFHGQLLVYPPENERPYEREELQAARAFLSAIGAEVTSQRDLANLLQAHELQRPAPSDFVRFLREGYYATPGDFRDIDERSRPCVLDQDLPAVRGAHRARKPIDEWIVSVPRGVPIKWGEPGIPPYLGVASAACYSSAYGFDPAGTSSQTAQGGTP